jgi:hypothetical protein
MIYLCRGWLTIQTKSRWWANILIKNGFVEITADDYDTIASIVAIGDSGK